ncbi:bifunctional phosphopantothenoylcysteine decarboxylase/phosphopantothenate--cysteine ligase CoaBC [Parvularcula sp. LCG005]|uniref:bifunctional phosphopantothenoylcysteine decarboxylase/phosphopantothenate--cysteine ligase CoaBC n=1 Tax=Parvularcula sp. LCG005 TaxID=3078805 RepID=UPI002941E1F9|nr:bifunctional phosphopantothenoylcysteine decarboxylase/phosphopantothenate--cysteine ligase CoaBC [Parvularcula sp. LCG005]WOI53245.1 bifunctional phosphopantothenoylcysteine decarboxylase/phosphopantothenate--cysteine ligase CoaBC [Parvularcula sp. LCG005]
MAGSSVLLIIGGGIAAYKSLYLIRALKKEGIGVTGVLTRGGAEFITPLSVASLSGQKCYTDLFDLTDEAEMGHIELSRQADLVVVAPATANLLGQAAGGLADDLASTLLLATDKKVLFAPAMNVRMWQHPSVQRNVGQLRADGALFVGPDDGDMACGEFGPGRMSEPDDIVAAIKSSLSGQPIPTIPKLSADSGGGALTGRHILVTAGPTQEALDPVRYLGNRSSGKQGYALARACADLGATVTLVSGPTHLPDPEGIKTIRVDTARQMLAACQDALPADVAIMCAAVADYRPAIETDHKIKKERGGLTTIALTENPDILRTLSQMKEGRPPLMIGFAAETDDVIGHAEAKRFRKGCDWIVANDVSPGTGVMGGDRNRVVIISDDGEDIWDEMQKGEVAERLALRIADHLAAG